MACGRIGEPGVAVVSHAAVDHKSACALVPVHLLPVGAQIVKEVVPRRNRATQMVVQVRGFGNDGFPAFLFLLETTNTKETLLRLVVNVSPAGKQRKRRNLKKLDRVKIEVLNLQ